MSPKLPNIRPDKLIRALKKAGFFIDHQKGSHIYFLHANGKRTTVPYHKKDIGKGLLHEILKQAGLTVQDLIDLL
ncbi:MAG: type II toxin-antitoxin system HicA family toxin [Candidatus Electryonea clarkiae]|nr:type II toxin-antitoxin system HicA family toxin [Candidatus Electryonea clarkiae]MDP8288774.1 type II toxin-antitoxin system HicA family toxin [Candidatus Electryonea clarkiae]